MKLTLGRIPRGSQFRLEMASLYTHLGSGRCYSHSTFGLVDMSLNTEVEAGSKMKLHDVHIFSECLLDNGTSVILVGKDYTDGYLLLASYTNVYRLKSTDEVIVL